MSEIGWYKKVNPVEVTGPSPGPTIALLNYNPIEMTALRTGGTADDIWALC